MNMLNEMAAQKICGNCGQPMSGNHFYRQIGGTNVAFCKGDAIARAKAAGLHPTDNKSFPAGTSTPIVSSTPATSTPTSTPTGSTPSGTVTPTPAGTTAATPSPSTQTYMTEIGPVDKTELESWLSDFGIGPTNYSVTNGRLNITGDFQTDEQEYSQLAIPFGEVTGGFEVTMSSLETLANFPTKIGGTLHIMNSQITTLKELNVDVGSSVTISGNDQLTDVRGIHKHIKSAGVFVSLDFKHVKTGGLGLLLIKDITFVETGNSELDKILNKYLEEDTRTQDSLLDCQEELIDAGLGQFAKL